MINKNYERGNRLSRTEPRTCPVESDEMATATVLGSRTWLGDGRAQGLRPSSTQTHFILLSVDTAMLATHQSPGDNKAQGIPYSLSFTAKPGVRPTSPHFEAHSEVARDQAIPGGIND